MFRLLVLFLALCLAFAQPGLAQDQPQPPDYNAWNKLADQAEDILESGSANDARLQTIRDEVAPVRSRASRVSASSGPCDGGWRSAGDKRRKQTPNTVA